MQLHLPPDGVLIHAHIRRQPCGQRVDRSGAQRADQTEHGHTSRGRRALAGRSIRRHHGFPQRLVGDDFLLEFISGEMDYKLGNNWEQAYIGDYIPEDAQIKVHEGTFAELVCGNKKITISKNSHQ